jgi:hypothetical protein
VEERRSVGGLDERRRVEFAVAEAVRGTRAVRVEVEDIEVRRADAAAETGVEQRAAVGPRAEAEPTDDAAVARVEVRVLAGSASPQATVRTVATATLNAETLRTRSMDVSLRAGLSDGGMAVSTNPQSRTAAAPSPLEQSEPLYPSASSRT